MGLCTGFQPTAENFAKSVRLGDFRDGGAVANRRAVARRRVVDYSTVWKWRRSGRLPEASGGGAAGRPVLIPEDATVLDWDLARDYPAGLALVLHWYRHARTDAAQGHAIALAMADLPEDWTRAFFETVAGWHQKARERRRLEPAPPLVNLRVLRQERGLTQPALAEKAGKNQTAISALEARATEGRGARRGAAEDLARALGVPLEALWESGER